MSKENKLRAFPLEPSGYEPEFGMTLRDYFAAKAMHQFVYGAVLPEGFDAKDSFRIVSERAYELADSMLKARTA